MKTSIVSIIIMAILLLGACTQLPTEPPTQTSEQLTSVGDKRPHIKIEQQPLPCDESDGISSLLCIKVSNVDTNAVLLHLYDEYGMYANTEHGAPLSKNGTCCISMPCGITYSVVLADTSWIPELEMHGPPDQFRIEGILAFDGWTD